MKPSPAVSLLLTNLRLLDYDFATFSITPDVFTDLTNKGKAFEHIIYHLFNIFDPEECALVGPPSSHVLPAPSSLMRGSRNYKAAGQSTSPRNPASCGTWCSNGWTTSRRVDGSEGCWFEGRRWTIAAGSGTKSSCSLCRLWCYGIGLRAAGGRGTCLVLVCVEGSEIGGRC